MITKNPVFLVITGHPSNEEILQAWEFIKIEYSDLIRTPKSVSIHDVWKKIQFTKFKIELINECVEFLKYKGYDEEIAGVIVEHGFSYVTNKDDYSEYLKGVYLVETEAKVLQVLLNQYFNEYKLLCPDTEVIAERTVADYDREIAIVQKFMGTIIRKKDITVAEWCSYFNLYIESQINL